jgi:hypothetical protein
MPPCFWSKKNTILFQNVGQYVLDICESLVDESENQNWQNASTHTYSSHPPRPCHQHRRENSGLWSTPTEFLWGSTEGCAGDWNATSIFHNAGQASTAKALISFCDRLRCTCGSMSCCPSLQNTNKTGKATQEGYTPCTSDLVLTLDSYRLNPFASLHWPSRMRSSTSWTHDTQNKVMKQNFS